MASTKLLQRLREKLRRAQQEADEHRATAEDLQARMAANENTRRKTELDGDSTPAVDISRQLITPGAKPPPKHRPGVASKAAAAIARRVRPSSQEALQAMGSRSVFGPAASHSDERFRQHEEAPAPYLTGALHLVHPHHAAPAPAPTVRRSFSLATPSPFGEPPPVGTGSGLTGAPSLAPLEDDEPIAGGPRRYRPSSHEALLSLFSSGPVVSAASSFGDDRPRLQDARHGPFLSGSAPLLPAIPPAAASTPRRTFSLSTPPPFDPPQPLSTGTGFSGNGSLQTHEPAAASLGWFGDGPILEGAPPLMPRDD